MYTVAQYIKVSDKMTYVSSVDPVQEQSDHGILFAITLSNLIKTTA